MRCGKVLLLLCVVVLALVGSGAGNAAEQAPLSKQRAIAIASPGVVYIETAFDVTVRIKLADESLARAYRAVPYGSGSGFVVDPSGTIITARHVVKPDDQTVRNYAANSLFAGVDLFGTGKLSISGADLYKRWTVNGDPEYSHRLQQCYDNVICTFQVTPHVMIWTGVALAGTQLAKGLEARVLKVSERGANNTDIGILQVDGKNMPTTPLARTVDGMQQGDDVIALGFPGTAQENNVTAPHSKAGTVGTVGTVGTTKQLEVDINIEQGMSGGPVINLQGQVVGVNSYYIARSTGESGTKYARSIDDARELLNASGKTASRGVVDEHWQRAVDLYFLHHYTAAIPELNAVLTAYPGHPLATEYLQEATSLKGTAQDRPLGGGGLDWWVIALIVLGGLLALGALALLLARRGALPAALTRRAPRPRPARGRAAATITGDGVGEMPSLSVTGGGHAGKTFAVPKELTIGRSDADITLDDNEISRRHAVVRRIGSELEISDEGSSNGTYVNGKRIDGRSRLAHGDTIRVGQTTLEVALPGRRALTTDDAPTLVIRDGDAAGKRYPIDRERSIGRETADIIVNDAEISRRHASLRPVEGGLEISDLQSSNGTFVNGSRINGGHRLAPGDVIRMGDTTFDVEFPSKTTGTVVRGGTVVRSDGD